MEDLYSALNDEDADVRDIITSEPTDLYVPLVGIRKAICVRILNTFLDNRNRVAFTIWAYDVESGMEWYAPVRYYSDFKDLQVALLRVDKAIAEIPFPTMNYWFSSEAKESAKTKVYGVNTCVGERSDPLR